MRFHTDRCLSLIPWFIEPITQKCQTVFLLRSKPLCSFFSPQWRYLAAQRKTKQNIHTVRLNTRPARFNTGSVCLLRRLIVFSMKIKKKKNNKEYTSWSVNHASVFSSSSRLLATCTIFCWSAAELITLLFIHELYLTSWTSTSSEVHSSLGFRLILFPGFVKLASSVTTVLIFVEFLPLNISST